MYVSFDSVETHSIFLQMQCPGHTLWLLPASLLTHICEPAKVAEVKRLRSIFIFWFYHAEHVAQIGHRLETN